MRRKLQSMELQESEILLWKWVEYACWYQNEYIKLALDDLELRGKVRARVLAFVFIRFHAAIKNLTLGDL